MNGRDRFASHFAWLTVVVCLVACQQTGSPPMSTTPGSPELPGEALQSAPPVADSPGKPLPPIDFRYEILGKPAIGQPLEIRVTSSAQAALDGLNVALSGDERVQVPAEIARFRMARTTASAPMTRTIRVTPLASGTLYLNVLVQADIDGRSQSRAVTIPIRVGADPRPSDAEGVVSTDADGQPIISLPASDR